MAQPTYEYSGVCYTAASGQTIFALTSTDGNPIGYLSPNHIYVRTSADSGETWVPLPVDTAWNFADPATSIVLVTPATAGLWVDIQRKTPIDKDWVDFQAGSLLTAGQLNDAETFSLYCDQELTDEVGNLTPPEIGIATTDDLPEGQVNLYYTNERVAEYIAENPSGLGVTKIIPGTNITLTPSTGEGVVTINSTGGGGSGGIIYKGLVDITQPAPLNPQEGDLWANTTEGFADDSWIGIAGQEVGIGDEPVYNGTQWQVFPRPPIVGAVESVNGQTGVVTIGVEQLSNYEEYSGGSEGPASVAYPTYVPDSSSGFTAIAQWSFTAVGGQAYANLCSTDQVLTAYRENIQLGDEVTFEYYITNIITGEPQVQTQTHPVLETDLVTPADGSLPYMRILTQCTFQALNSNYPLIFTYSGLPPGGTPNGHVLQWNATDGKWTPGTNTVEQLADFAYYPSSNLVTLPGPQVSTSTQVYEGTEFSGQPGQGGSSFQFRKETNLPFFNGLSQLKVGDQIDLTWNNGGTMRTDSVEFRGLSESNQAGGWTLCLFGVQSPLGTMFTGDYYLSVYSPLITNGEEPIRTGQALIYDQTTAKWRPENISAGLNISALPALP